MAAVVLAAEAAAFAQAAAPSFASARFEGLPTIYVLDRSGRETMGRLVSFTETALVLSVNGVAETFEPAQVRRVQRAGDSLKNGTIIGLVVGAFFGLVTGGFADCPEGEGGCPGVRVAGALIATGFYTALGAGIDAAIKGRTLLWESGQPSPVARAPVAIRFAPGRVVVSSAFRW